MTTPRKLRINDATIEYTLQRSKRRRKTVGIKVARGVVEVTAPTRTLIREIEEILRKRGSWILERLEAASRLPPPRQLITGESMPVMGRDLPLLVDESNVRRALMTFDGERLSVLVPAGMSGEDHREQVEAAIVLWYKGELQAYLQRSVAHWLPVMGRSEMPRVLVRDQRSRWGQLQQRRNASLQLAPGYAGTWPD